MPRIRSPPRRPSTRPAGRATARRATVRCARSSTAPSNSTTRRRWPASRASTFGSRPRRSSISPAPSSLPWAAPTSSTSPRSTSRTPKPTSVGPPSSIRSEVAATSATSTAGANFQDTGKNRNFDTGMVRIPAGDIGILADGSPFFDGGFGLAPFDALRDRVQQLARQRRLQHPAHHRSGRYAALLPQQRPALHRHRGRGVLLRRTRSRSRCRRRQGIW